MRQNTVDEVEFMNRLMREMYDCALDLGVDAMPGQIYTQVLLCLLATRIKEVCGADVEAQDKKLEWCVNYMKASIAQLGMRPEPTVQ
jgi:hypothetical protein